MIIRLLKRTNKDKNILKHKKDEQINYSYCYVLVNEMVRRIMMKELLTNYPDDFESLIKTKSYENKNFTFTFFIID